MRRPNPWITIPAVLLGLLAGALGWVVTEASCRQGGSECLGWSVLFSAVAFVSVTAGVGLVLVLVYRSLTEWRQKSSDRTEDQ